MIAFVNLYFLGKQFRTIGTGFLIAILIVGVTVTGSRAGFTSLLVFFGLQFVHSLIIRSRIGALLAATYLALLVGLPSLLLFLPRPHWGPVARFLEQGFVDDIRTIENERLPANLFHAGFGEIAYDRTHNSSLEILQNFGVVGGIIYRIPFLIALVRIGKSYGAVQLGIMELFFSFSVWS